MWSEFALEIESGELQDALRLSRDELKTSNGRRFYRSHKYIDILDSTSGHNLTHVLDEVTSLGGYVVIGPDEDEHTIDPSFKIVIGANDFVIPMCHEGMNRSQVLSLVLETLKTFYFVKSKFDANPHGAESGFDPYKAHKDLTPDNWFGYIHGKILPRGSKGEWMHDCFYEAFGAEKSQRIGEEVAGSTMLNPSEDDLDGSLGATAIARTAQRLAMDDLLYDADNLRAQTGPTGKVIVICFCRAGGIFMERLLEVNKARGKSLDNIYVVCLPWADTISRAGGKSEIEKYGELTGKLVSREFINVKKHIEVFNAYASLLVPAPATMTPVE